MWKQGRNILSAFVGVNQGEILDCHIKSFTGKGKVEQPFCYSNEGIIENVSDITDVKSAEEQSAGLEVQEVDSVIEVRSAEQLLEICKQVNLGDSFYYSGHYRLINDLDLKGMKWIPMGSSEREPFCGIFDGNGYAIKNVKVKGSLRDYSGFFGYLKQAVVKRLSLEGTVAGGAYTGALAGVSEDSDITSCFVSAHVYGRYYTGGFVGKNAGRIKHCYCAGKVAKRKIWII